MTDEISSSRSIARTRLQVSASLQEVGAPSRVPPSAVPNSQTNPPILGSSTASALQGRWPSHRQTRHQLTKYARTTAACSPLAFDHRNASTIQQRQASRACACLPLGAVAAPIHSQRCVRPRAKQRRLTCSMRRERRRGTRFVQSARSFARDQAAALTAANTPSYTCCTSNSSLSKARMARRGRRAHATRATPIIDALANATHTIGMPHR